MTKAISWIQIPVWTPAEQHHILFQTGTVVWTRNYKLNYNNANRPNQHCSSHSCSALKVWPLKPALHSQKRSHFFYIARNINSLKQAYKSWKIKTWVPLSKGNFSISKVSAPAQKFYFPSQHLHFRIAYCISCTPNRRLFHLYHQIHILFFFIKLDFPNIAPFSPRRVSRSCKSLCSQLSAM